MMSSAMDKPHYDHELYSKLLVLAGMGTVWCALALTIVAAVINLG